MTDDDAPTVVPFPQHPSRKPENELNAELDDAALVRRVPYHLSLKQGRCDHKHAQLDFENRRVYCRDCNVELDPIDVLNMIAGEADRYIESIRLFHRRSRQLRDDVADLERQERNAKARIRNARKRRDDREALIAAASVRNEFGVGIGIGGYRPWENLSDEQREIVLVKLRLICEAYVEALTRQVADNLQQSPGR